MKPENINDYGDQRNTSGKDSATDVYEITCLTRERNYCIYKLKKCVYNQ